MDKLFYLYSVTNVKFLMQKNLGYTDKLDVAGTFTQEQSVRILKKFNVDGQEIVAVNILQPSRKPNTLDNNLNHRVFVYNVRKRLGFNGLDAKSTSFDEITTAYKKGVSVENFIQRKLSFDALDTINESLFHFGIY